MTEARGGGRLRAVGGREPPHDLNAEEAVLGTMLLSTEAARTAIETCAPGDFYKPAHGHVFEAIEHLVISGRPADPITVGDELKRLGYLEVDPADLLHLQAGAVGSSSRNAEHYGEIVSRHAATRRRLHAYKELHDATWSDDQEAVARWQAVLSDEAQGRAELQADDIAALMRSPQTLVQAELLKRVDGRALLVRGTVNVIFGEPEAGKSFVTAEAMRQTMLEGGRVALLDYEGTPARMAERLTQLRLSADVVEHGMLYLRPGGAAPAKQRAWMAAIVRTVVSFKADLVVLDSLAAFLYEFGLNENDASEALTPLRGVCRPLANAGAAVVAVDHVKKESEARDPWGRGSGSKRGEVDSSFHLKVVEPFAREKPGSSFMRVAKDRDGILGGQGQPIATVNFGEDLGGHFRIALQPPATETPFVGPTHCMDAVLELLEARGDEMSGNEIITALKITGRGYKEATVRESAERLAADPDKPVSVRTGAHRRRLFRYDPRPAGVADSLDLDEF